MGAAFGTGRVVDGTVLRLADRRPRHDRQVPHHAPGAYPSLFLQRYAMEPGDRFGAHAHDHAQLSWTPGGLLFAETGAVRWTLPASTALWLPPGVAHDVGASRRSWLYNVYLDGRRRPPGLRGVAAVAVTPLVRQLFLHLADDAVVGAHRGRVEELFLELLQPVSLVTTSLVPPVDPLAAKVADALLADPANDDTLAAWGARLGAHRRTLARRFVAETGLTFGDWRTQARVRAALTLLADGVPPGRVAGQVGYRTASAFTSAFRRTTGSTPGAVQRRLLSNDSETETHGPTVCNTQATGSRARRTDRAG